MFNPSPQFDLVTFFALISMRAQEHVGLKVAVKIVQSK
jgi:hypothetical protein